MAYIAQADLSPQPVPLLDLIELTDDDGTNEVSATVLDAVLLETDAAINSHVAGRYAVPLTVNDAVKNIARDIAVFKLYERRKRVPRSVREKHDAAMELLAEVKRGGAQLAGQTVVQEILTIDREATPQVFGDDNLEAYK